MQSLNLFNVKTTNQPNQVVPTAQIIKEFQMGNYEVVSEPPLIVSPMGVIPKPDGGVRLIHDCSLPKGGSVNDYCSTDWHQKFSRVDDAAALVTKGCYMAKVDLQSAYRSVKISDHSKQVTGLKWQFGGKTIYLRDTRLCFGSKLAPGIFHRLTQAVRRMLIRRGLKATVVYLDDFFIKADTLLECAEAMNILIALLRKLGFQINWKKVVDPSTRIIFLGIEIDSIAMCLRLPEDKLSQVRQELSLFLNRKRASKKQLQSLAGKLNFCASVVYGGRGFSRCIIDTINLLKEGSHKTILSASIKSDILWWHNFMASFNGRSMLLDKQPITSVFTDSCNVGAGAVYEGDWFYTNWQLDWPVVTNFHINSKEILAVFLAVCRWAPLWSNKRIYIQSDNITTVATINRGTSRDPFISHASESCFGCQLDIIFTSLLGSYRVKLMMSQITFQGFMNKGGWVSFCHTLSQQICPCTCLRPAYLFFLVDSLARERVMTALDQEVATLRVLTFAESTRRTYQSQQSLYLQFCAGLNIAPVPISSCNLGRYIAYLGSNLVTRQLDSI